MISTEQNTQNLLATARQHFNEGRFSSAEALLDEVILADASQPDAFHLLGCIYYRMGKIKKSIKTFRRALDIDPGHTDATLGLSMVLNDTGRYEEAQKVFTQGREKLNHDKKEQLDSFLSHQLASKHLELGDLYFQGQRYEEAADQYFEAYKYADDKIKVRMKIVECMVRKNELGRAIKELRLICHEASDHIEARLKLGLLYYKQKQTLEAVEQWEAILLRDPEHPEALKYLKMAQQNNTTVLL